MINRLATSSAVRLSLIALALLASRAALAAPGGLNTAPITINDNAPASLYPSTITVTQSFPLTNIAVRLDGLQHPRPSDLRVLLVSPSGEAVQLMADVTATLPGTQEIVIAEPGSTMHGKILNSSTIYRPTTPNGAIAMPSPAPALPYATSFESLIGDESSGTWSLYVSDGVTGLTGSISNGWVLTLNASASTPFLEEFTYQGVVTEGGVPVNGVRDIELGFWDSPYSTFAGYRRGVFSKTGVQVTNGRFTVLVPVESTYLTDDRQLFVEVMVRNPAAGPEFTTLSPRQQITPTPYSIYSRYAAIADSVLSVAWTQITGVPANVANPFTPWTAGGGNSIFNSNTGNVLIGTAAGNSKLTVNGVVESLSGGVKFPDGTVQTTKGDPSPVVASGVFGVNMSAIAAGGVSTVTVGAAASNLQTTDIVIVQPQTDPPNGLIMQHARVSSGTQIRVTFYNATAASIDPPLTQFNFRVLR